MTLSANLSLLVLVYEGTRGILIIVLTNLDHFTTTPQDENKRILPGSQLGFRFSRPRPGRNYFGSSTMWCEYALDTISSVSLGEQMLTSTLSSSNKPS